MEKVFYIKPLCDFLSGQKNLRNLCTLALRITAVAAAVLGLIAWIYGWIIIFQAGSYYSGVQLGWVFAGVLIEILMVAFFYMLIHLLWLRAETVQNLPESDYTVIPVISVFFKLIGEIWAVVFTMSSLVIGLSMLFGVGNMISAFGFFGAMGEGLPFGLSSLLNGLGVFGGFAVILFGALKGFGFLIFFYFLAEVVMVFADIARGVKK